MRVVLISLFIIFSCLVSFNHVLAFDETFTHPYLTRLIVEEWNRLSLNKISKEQTEQIILGSQAEDNPPSRSLNHFYNPLNNEGLSVNGLIVGYPAPDWAYNGTQQAEPLFGGSFTWPQALALKQDSDERAFFALGHILHLVEDMGVPAHTRNDEHLYGDGLEGWCKIENSLEPKLSLDWTKVSMSACADLRACLDDLAWFSNNNFFSDNTINQIDFAEPYGQMSLGPDSYYYASGRPLAFLDKQSNRLILNSLIFRNYWQALAPEVIGHGLKVLDLFFNQSSSTPQLTEQTKQARGQISAGGIKITAKAPKDIKFNDSLAGLSKPVYDYEKLVKEPSSRFFPVIDVSQFIPPQFLGQTREVFIPSSAPVENTPLVAGEKINQETSSQPTVSGPDDSQTIKDTEDSQINSPIPDNQPPPASQESSPPVVADQSPPTANFVDLPTVSIGNNFEIFWQGQDDTSLESSLLFDFDYKLKDTDWLNWQTATNTTSAIFDQVLPEETRLDLRLRAVDESGNAGSWQTGSTLVFKDDNHNPLIYEKLEHLYHFAECQDSDITDSQGDWSMNQNATWIDGRWGCGLHQDYFEQQSIGTNWSKTIATDELTLALFFKDVSNYPVNYSRNRFILFDKDSAKTSDWALGFIPTILYTKVYVNGQLYNLPALEANHNWHSLFLVANADYLAFYIDGQLKEQLFGDFSIKNPIRGINIVGENSPSEFDELTIWSRSLSSGEVKAYYDINQPLKLKK